MDIFISFIVVAIVQLAKYINAKDWDKAILIIASGIAGGLVAAFATQLGFAPITIAEGITQGLAGSGLVTVAGYASKK